MRSRDLEFMVLLECHFVGISQCFCTFCLFYFIGFFFVSEHVTKLVFRMVMVMVLNQKKLAYFKSSVHARKWSRDRKWSSNCTANDPGNGNGRLAVKMKMCGLRNLDSGFKFYILHLIFLNNTTVNFNTTVTIGNASKIYSIWKIWMQISQL